MNEDARQARHGRRALRISAVGISVALALYPLIVYFGLRYFATVSVAILFAGLCILRWLVGRASRHARPFGRGMTVVCLVGVALAIASTLTRSPDAMLFYPVVVNAILMATFAYSLLSPPTVIERLARIGDPNLSPAGVAYTRKATQAWILFFFCNGSIALYTALFSSMEIWAFYNGMLAYILIGAMFAGEWIVRGIVMKGAAK